MRYDRLYDLREEFECDGAFRGAPEDGVIADPFALLGNVEKPTRPIRFDYHCSGGESVCDVIWTGFVAVVLLSDPLVDVLRGEAFSGWTTYPAEVYDKRSKKLPKYHGLAVTGRAGPIDNTRSERVWRGPYFPGGPKVEQYVGLYFQYDRWDGSDIFLPEGSGWIVVTERVKDVLDSLDIPNIKLVRLTTLERDVK